MACLNDTTVFRFVAGRLDEASRREVEAEVGRCGRCAALVAGLLRSGPSSPGALDVEAPAGPGDGAEGGGPEGRYAFGGEIARGGMGTILHAFDRRLVRSIAVKRIDSRAPALEARFAREIRITASLQHPGIVPVYDAGLLPDGRPFYAMRHVPGASLERAIAACGDGGARLALLAPVLAAAEAVAYAHERGVVHRDLKPSNVLVGPFGETVVIDWGLAKIDEGPSTEPAEPAPAGDPGATVEGAVLGTPRYMAPEQARGEPATCRSDVYALGAILYHALSGLAPVSGDEVDAVIERAARAEIAPLRRVAPGLPSDLVAVVERAMAPAPGARYADAGELAADLRRFQTGQLVAAHAYSRRDLARRFALRHRAALALSALFALVLALGGALSVRRVVRERERADRERSAAEALVQFLVRDLRHKLNMVGRLDVLAGVADRVESYYLSTAAGRAELPDVTLERVALSDLRGDVIMSRGDSAVAARHYQQGLDLVDRAPRTPRALELRASLLGGLALRASKTGDAKKARALHLEAGAIYRSLLASDAAKGPQRALDLAATLISSGLASDMMGRFDEAERDWGESRDILEGLRARDPNDLEAAHRLAKLRLYVGQSRLERRRPAEAKASLEAAHELGAFLTSRELQNVDFQYLVLWSDISLADLLAAEGRPAEAGPLRERARETARLMVALEPEAASWHSTLARTEADLGALSAARSDWATAAACLRAARAGYGRMVALEPNDGDFRRDAGAVSARLAAAEAELGHGEAARAAWLDALALFAGRAESGEAGARIEWADALRGYAAFERKAGRLDAAASALERSLALVNDTPFSSEEPPGNAFYRAAVLAEVGAARAARRPAEAREARSRAAALLRDLAERAPLEPEWARLRQELDAALAPASLPKRGAGRP